MSTALRSLALLVIVLALVLEAIKWVAAPGLVVLGGLSLAGYLWFLAAAARPSGAPLQRRRS